MAVSLAQSRPRNARFFFLSLMATSDEPRVLSADEIAWLEAQGWQRPVDASDAQPATADGTDPPPSSESHFTVCKSIRCCHAANSANATPPGRGGAYPLGVGGTACPLSPPADAAPVMLWAVGQPGPPASGNARPPPSLLGPAFPLAPTGDESSGQDGVDPQRTLPLFDPGSQSSAGLDLLAAAAAAKKGKSDRIQTAPLPLLTQPGPFNPAAALSMKVVRKILDLEFVEMSEVTIDDVLPAVPGRPPPPARLPIMDISQWVERFSLMAAVLCTKFPHKAGEFLAYQASIIRAERNYEGKRWVAYDRQYHRQALARQDLNWSVTDARLYNEAFTG